MHRTVTLLLLVLAALVVVGVGAVVWQFRVRHDTFFTDADTIRRPVDAASPRDVLWRPAVGLPEAINSGRDEHEPRVSADGGTLFLVRGKAGRDTDIFCCTRTPRGWSEPRPLAAINTEADELGPEPSPDGRSLYFSSNRGGGSGAYDLWVTHRLKDGWGPPANLGPEVNSRHDDYGPAVAPDGTTLYFASNRPVPDLDSARGDAPPAAEDRESGRRDYDIYAATIIEGVAGPAASAAALNTPHNESGPAVSPAGDFVYFCSDRPGGEGGFDLYRSRPRPGGHTPPRNLGAPVNTPLNELDPAVNLGGFGLHFSSNRPRDEREPAGSPDYDLYYTTSREVFRQTDTYRASIDWALIWATFGPYLLAAVLVLLVLLALMTLLKRLEYRRLSLVIKCLFVSLLVHMLLGLCFAFWAVTTSGSDWIRPGRGMRVALVSPSLGAGLARQIRGDLTNIELEPSWPVPTQPRYAPGEQDRLPASAAVTVARSAIEEALRRERPVAVSEAPSRFMDPPAPSDASTLLDRLAVQEVDLPRQLEPVDESEAAVSIPKAALARMAPRAAEPPLPASSRAATPRDASVRVPPRAVSGPAQETFAPQTVEAAAAPSPSLSFEPQRALFRDLAGGLGVKLPVLPEQRESRQPEERPVVNGLAGSARPAPVAPRLPTEPAYEPVAPVRPPGDGAAESFVLARPQEAASTPALSSPSAPVVAGGPEKIRLALPRLEESARQGEPETTGGPLVVAPGSPRAPWAEPSVVRRPRPPVRVQDPPTAEAPPGRPLLPSVDLDVSPRRLATRLDSSGIEALALDTVDLDLRLPAETMPDPYAQRAPKRRQEILEQMGGTEETERAVALALDWLARHQSADGGWDGTHFDDGCGRCAGIQTVKSDIALTGLALLCFTAAGHTHVEEGPYRDVVARGVSWLVKRQRASGDLRGGESLYSHGIASIALAEAYGMTGDAGLAGPVKAAAEFTYAARNKSRGGWRYTPGQFGDTSVLGWQVMALVSARRARVDVPAEAFEVARQWLELVRSPTRPGQYAYQPGRGITPAMTAEGMFVGQLLGAGRDQGNMQASARYLLRHPPRWETDANTYYWYYATLALFQHQGRAWAHWNEAVTAQLLAHQVTSGRAAGSWDPKGTGDEGRGTRGAVKNKAGTRDAAKKKSRDEG
ncbi:MAG: hypothetical protein ACYS0G_11920 [Planctomycetota bacterium]|jgi:hypothetical protein